MEQIQDNHISAYMIYKVFELGVLSMEMVGQSTGVGGQSMGMKGHSMGMKV